MLAAAATQYAREGWTPGEVIQAIVSVTALLSALTAFAKTLGLERKHTENAAKIDLNAAKADVNEKRIEEVKTDVRAVRSDLTTVAAISTPNASPKPIVPADIHEMMLEGKGQ
jgi:hypothetical protein